MGWAQSHPSWWTYVPQDATALVGVNWDHLRGSPLGAAVESELSEGGEEAVFGYAALKQARQVLLAGPGPLAIVNGEVPQAALRAQFAAKGMKRVSDRGVELWIPPGANGIGAAVFNEQLVLLGARKILEGAIDRLPSEKGAAEGERNYSPLLQKAARFSQDDLWVVAAALPDALASRFVPLEAEASGFAGSVSLARGLRVEATLEAGSAAAGEKLAAELRGAIRGLPPVARGMQVSATGGSVVLALDISPEQLQASLRRAAEARPLVGVELESPPVIQTVAVNGARIEVSAWELPAAAPPAAVVPATPVAAVADKPVRQVVRILGLEEGVREIELPPVQ